MPISDGDALALHKAIHSGKKSVTLKSGETLPVEENSSKCKIVKVASAGVQATEQNKTKSSEWAKKAKAGSKITWILGASPWGRIVDGKIDSRGATIVAGDDDDVGCAAVATKSKAKAEAKAVGKAKAKAKEAAASAAEAAKPSKVKASASVAGSAKASASEPPAKKAKIEPATPDVMPAESPSDVLVDSADPLDLARLFSGMGHGSTWEKLIRPLLESLPNAAKFIGPGRDKRIVPVRELTFQALKPNPPSGWRVVSFGQSPFPRIESATGIAHFDNAVSSWEDSRFGSVVTMRCIIKAAAMGKFGISKNTTTDELRKLLKSKGIVGPAEWFQAMLSQGVLFMNAACTLLPPEDKSVRAGGVIEEHAAFWLPVIEAVCDALLNECRQQGKGLVFAWWGSESLKIKRKLKCLKAYPDVNVEHIEHCNPAAMGDAFCNPPNIFDTTNKALKKLKLPAIDWLPSAGWQDRLGLSMASQMGDFIAETQELHKMYLERLRDGLDNRQDDLPDITGIMSQALVCLSEACKSLRLTGPADQSVSKAKGMSRSKLSVEEAGSIHLYTTNHLYKMLNAALRSDDRGQIKQYFLYLRLFLSALKKLPSCSLHLYRGVGLDLSAQYVADSVVTWWAVSSCTPDLKVASSFGGGSKSTLFVVKARTGTSIKEFSEFKGEDEFILAPGTQFMVEKVEHKGKLVEVHMRELDRPARVQ